MINILNKITHRPLLPDMNFGLLDIEIYTTVTYNVLIEKEKKTISVRGKINVSILFKNDWSHYRCA